MANIRRSNPVTVATRRAELSLHAMMLSLAALCGVLFYWLAAGLALNLKEETYTQYAELSQVIAHAVNERAERLLSALVNQPHAPYEPVSAGKVSVEDKKLFYVSPSGERRQLGDAEMFFAAALQESFLKTAMADRCELRLRFQANPLLTMGNLVRDPRRATEKEPVPIFGTTLTPPFDGFHLGFVTMAVPLARSGAEARVLVGTIIILLIVGFGALYLMALRQVDLAEERARFVAAVSHELRTPLTAIRMYTELLSTPSLGSDEKRAEYLKIIGAESERLQHLVADLLDLSRYARGLRRLEIQPVTVASLIELVESRLRSMIEAKGSSLELQDNGLGEELVNVDQEAFLRTVFNIVDNSLRYGSSSERRIDFTVVSERRFLVFAIRDFGPGLRKPGKKLSDSTGIGLALVRETVKRMRGRLEVKEADPGVRVSIFLQRG